MASAGTLISDLDDSGGGGDGDLVQKILSDMNIPTSNRHVPQPLPQAPHGYQAPNSTQQQMTMDSQIPTSHMIGNEHPTSADFAAAMAGMASSRAGVAAMAESVGYAAPVPMPMPMPMPGNDAPIKNLYAHIVSEIKVPFVVAILFFIFSLPPIRVLVAHYMPSLIRPTGEFHITGLLVISIMMGATFWLMQRVIAPLLSL